MTNAAEALAYYQEQELDMVNHPPHYTSSPAKCSNCGHSIECKDVVSHMDFPLGSAIKYIWRVDLKGKPIEDLNKAIFWIKEEIAMRENSGEQG